jgi:hypothetical protein
MQRTMTTVLIASIVFAATLTAHSDEPFKLATKSVNAKTLLAEIEALKAPQVAWRQIAWKSCLLEGLRESRDTNKPALLWIFIDRPVDDARC